LEYEDVIKQLVTNLLTLQESYYPSTRSSDVRIQQGDVPPPLSKKPKISTARESGSGKSWFAKRYIPSIFPTTSIIYYELQDEDIVLQPQWNDMDTVEACQMYKDCIRALRGQEQMGSMVYDDVCELSWRIIPSQNQSAMNMMNTFVQRSIAIKHLNELVVGRFQ
jgi:hypothetical protein